MGSDSGRAPTGMVGRFLSGTELFLEGFRVLRAQRSLWVLASVPVLFSILASAIGLGLLISNFSDVRIWVDSMLPVVVVSHWYEWIWLGPAKVALAAMSCLILLVVAAAVSLISVLVASLLAAPFLDRLSWRVEKIEEGGVMESDDSGLRALSADLGRSLSAEVKRMVFFLSLWTPLVVVGFVIPGAQLITGPLVVVLTMLLLPLQFCGYTLDRRRVPFNRRRHWLQADAARMLGFGAVAFAACFVPGVNLVMIPILVTAGTLLVVRHPPA
ncbi:MAG: EI24 domain-containing protein [Myxococcota bacterium]|nr:EI24 domain-containing protein [Myxococcota bacterium]